MSDDDFDDRVDDVVDQGTEHEPAGGERTEGDAGGDAGGQSPSLRDTIVKSVKTLRERDETRDPKDKDAAPRAKNGAAGLPSPSKPVPGVKPGDAQTSSGAQAAQAATTAAPKWLSEEAKKAWGTVPDTVKQAITKFEQSSAHGVQQLKARHDAYDTEVAKLDQTFAKNGLDRVQGLQNLVKWAQQIEANPHQAINALAASYGLRANNPQNPQQPGQRPQPQGQPDLRSVLQPLLAPLQQELNQLKSARTNEAQAASDAAVNSWAKDKPHFEAVRKTMHDIVQIATKNGSINDYLDASGSIDLDKIYDQAVWMNPETRALVQAEQTKSRQAVQRQAAQKARRAGASVRPSTPSERTNSGKPSLRDTIREAMESVANR